MRKGREVTPANNICLFWNQDKQPVRPAIVVEKQELDQPFVLQPDFSVAAKLVREQAAELSQVDLGPDSELIARKCAAAADSFDRMHRSEKIYRDFMPFHLLYSVLTIMNVHPEEFSASKFDGTKAIIQDLAECGVERQEASLSVFVEPPRRVTMQYMHRPTSRFARVEFENQADAAQFELNDSGPSMSSI